MKPFLYLPDAVTLLLLWITLSLLRRAAVEHLRMELVRLRRDLSEHAPAPDVSAAFRSLIDSIARAAPNVSPARFFFVERCWREMARAGAPVADPIARLDVRIATVPDERTRDRLSRLRLELALTLGVFHLLGSISGWVLLGGALLRMGLRTLRRGGRNRLDRYLDFTERFIARAGSRAARLAVVTESLARSSS